METLIYLPDINTKRHSEHLIWKWYQNIEIELKTVLDGQRLNNYLESYYREAGLLTAWRRPFFKHHFARTFADAANHILAAHSKPLILDLGCGSGTQSLWFAIMGAEVIAVDMDDKALQLFEIRKIFYEKLLGRKLSIEIHESDIFKFNFYTTQFFNGIYSMFAFNMMQPSKLLLTILSDHSEPGCRLAILDGNNRSWLPRLIPSRKREHCLSPTELKNELAKRSFNVVAQTPGFCIPPIIWTFFPTPFLRKIDTLLGRSPLFTISYQTLAIKE